MTPSASLDSWRDYFRRGDSDIFGIIDHAIMVAAADNPKDFKSRRDRIAELLFSCKVSHCIGCDHLELSVAGEEEANHCRNTVRAVGADGGSSGGDKDASGDAADGGEDETKLNNNQIVSHCSYGEAEALSDEQEASVIVDEVMRIKDVLLKKEDESTSVLLESLRKLESMAMSVPILKDTEIGKAVNGLRKHSSDKITKLAKTLYAEWKELVEQWMNISKETADAGDEGTPDSANFSVVDETFPSPPHDLDFFVHEPTGFELSQILDCLDCDGNLLDSVESKHESNLQSSVNRRPERSNEDNVVGRYNKDQQMMREEVDVRAMKQSATVFDEPRRQPKQSREQTVLAIQRKRTVDTEQSREQTVLAIQRKRTVDTEQKPKLAGSQQDKLKALDPDARFEFAQRRLQESYQQHENAKRQRTIQVLETIPKKIKSQKPQFKKPARR